MGKRKFSNMELEKLVGQGLGVRQIARKLKVSPASVSERLKNLRVAVARNVAIRQAPELAQREFKAMDQMLRISEVVNTELDYIQRQIKEGPEEDRAKWHQAQLAHVGEIRKQIKLAVEIAQNIHKDQENAKIIEMLIEELKNVDKEAGERFYKRVHELRSIGRLANLP